MLGVCLFSYRYTFNSGIAPGCSPYSGSFVAGVPAAIGREPGEAENDEEGMRNMRVLGENMAWLLKKLAG